MTRDPVLVEDHAKTAVQDVGKSEKPLASDSWQERDRERVAAQDADRASGESECSAGNHADVDLGPALERDQEDLLL